MTDYYRDCRYCSADWQEEHEDTCPLYKKTTGQTANFNNLRKLHVGYD